MNRILFLALPIPLVALSGLAAFAAGPQAKVTDLSWMTGSYEGPIGNATLEENWAAPKGGSIASLVRATSPSGATTMIELIVVEEEAGSLMLRLQQWDPGLKPRTDAPQVMKLVESIPNKVVFENVGEGGMKRLGYSKTGNKFTISIERPNGTSRDIVLTAK